MKVLSVSAVTAGRTVPSSLSVPAMQQRHTATDVTAMELFTRQHVRHGSDPARGEAETRTRCHSYLPLLPEPSPVPEVVPVRVIFDRKWRFQQHDAERKGENPQILKKPNELNVVRRVASLVVW